MSAAAAEPFGDHRLLEGLAALETTVDGMDPAGWAGFESGVLRDGARRIARLEARLQAHRVAIARQLESSGAARKAGAGSTAELIARDFGGDRNAGHRLMETAQALESAQRTEQAMGSGEVSAD